MPASLPPWLQTVVDDRGALLAIAAGMGTLCVGLLIAILLAARRTQKSLAAGEMDVLMRLAADQMLTGLRSETETMRALFNLHERNVAASIADLRLANEQRLGTLSAAIVQAQGASQTTLDTRIATFTTDNATRLGKIETNIATAFGAVRTAMETRLGDLSTTITRGQGDARTLLETKLREMAEHTTQRLADIQKSVNENLHEAVEKQMTTSFQRVIDQIDAVQKTMVDVQAVTAQIGDIKRIFSNVKTRGGWGEAQLRAQLEDMLQPEAYVVNAKLREGSAEVVEFAVKIPSRGGDAMLLAIDAKFPVADYERLLACSEAGDVEGERAARRALETRLRQEGRKIADKYIVANVTVDFAIMYLPTDGLYAEAARVPGLIDDLGRNMQVMVMGPSLLPALLRTVRLGYMTLQLEEKAAQIGQLLGATKQEMQKMDGVLDKLAKNAGTMSKTIDDARVRTRAVTRKLKDIQLLPSDVAVDMLEIDVPAPEGEE